MPYKSQAQRKCRWCDNPPKKYINKVGVFKGYMKTCGSQNCLKAAYHDNAVNARKSWRTTKACNSCGEIYLSRSRSQKWCKECVPTKASGSIMRRYGLTKPEWDKKFTEQSGKCFLCDEKARVVDHNHKTGQVRKLLCYGCNLLVGLIERDKSWILKAFAYVN